MPMPAFCKAGVEQRAWWARCRPVPGVTTTVASEGDNSRGGAKGGAIPGRVREGGTPPAQLGGMGERCELPHRGLGRSPRS